LAPRPLSAHPHGPREITTHEHTALGLEITISDDEVVLDILMSNGFFNTIVPRERGGLKLQLEDDKFKFLDPRQEAVEREVFSEFFLDANRVTINGVDIKPVFRSLEFLKALDPTGRLDHSRLPPDARLVLSYPTATKPKQVAVVWEVFPKIAQRDLFGEIVPYELAARLDAEGESRIVTFTEAEPEVSWHAPRLSAAQQVRPVVVAVAPATIGIPVASAVAVGLWACGLLWVRRANTRGWRRRRVAVITVVAAAVAIGAQNVLVTQVTVPWRTRVLLPDGVTAAETFTQLLRNVYRAFDYKSESDVYDVLSQSVAGDELEMVYNEVFQSLIVREQGGAVARVKDVNVLETEIEFAGELPDSGEVAFQVHCRWRVHGVVYHWGHVHERTNEYEALHTVAQRDGYWKIIDTAPLEQRRVDRFDGAGENGAGGDGAAIGVNPPDGKTP
jgi:hypothetical protein